MMMNPKLTEKLAKLTEVANAAAAVNNPGAGKAFIDAYAAFSRIVARATPLPENFERVELVQTKGPRLEFGGQLLAETSFETSAEDPMSVTFEVWQTMAGALVAVAIVEPAARKGYENLTAAVVPLQDDVQAMHFAVMDAFEWGNAARKMADRLGWNLRMEVA